jgi:prephenate dehydrogenase
MKINSKKVFIIGLGLMGGSLAKAFRYRLNIEEIYAIDSNENSINEAKKDGIIKAGYFEITDAIKSADMIFICTPIKKAIEFLHILNKKVNSKCIITDICSTKGEIIKEVNTHNFSYEFIGGHPMTGSERNGYIASKEHLFENAYYILTKAKQTNAEAYKLLEEMIKGIGAIPLEMDEQEHDITVAAISHFPHVAAAALVNLIKDDEKFGEQMKKLAAGGFRDITRIAASDAEMWENIITSNKEQVIEISKKFITIIEDFQNTLSNKNSKGVKRHFEQAKKYRESMYNEKGKIIQGAFEIYVDVVDEPGTIGKIATILGIHNINIKNINVLNSREFENGCLLIAFRDIQSMGKAQHVLEINGIKAVKNN